MQRTAILRALQQLGATDFVDHIPALAVLIDLLELRFEGELWDDQAGEVEVVGHVASPRTRFDWNGVALTLGHGGPHVPTLPFSLRLPARPVEAVVAAAALEAGLATHENMKALLPGSGTLKSVAQRFASELASISLEIGPLPIAMELESEWLQPGRLVTNAAGEVVGVEPEPTQRRLAIPLGEVVLTAGASGLSLAFETPDAVSLPPLILAGTGLGLELKDLVLKLSEGPVPSAMREFSTAHGLRADWRGLYCGRVVLWNLDRILPGAPEGRAEDAVGARIETQGLAIDGNGITGGVVWRRAVQADTALLLEEVELGFDRSWYPVSLAGQGRLALTAEGAQPIGYSAALELNPFATSTDDRWRVEVALADPQVRAAPLLAVQDPPPALALSLAAVAAAFGDGDLALLLAALSAGIRTGIVSCQSAALRGAQMEGSLEPAGFAIGAALDLAVELQIDALDEPVPLALRGLVTIAYAHSTGFTAKWSLADGLQLALSTHVDLAGPVTLTRVGLLRRDDGNLAIELGMDIDGVGDLAIGGLPNVVTLVYDPGTDRFLPPELSRDGQIFSLLVPGTIYATGTLSRSANRFPQVGALAWGDPLSASLTVHLIGNGTAVAPGDHLQAASYLYSLDFGLLTATREDGLKALIVTGDLSFEPGLPLAATGAALYGIGLTYAQNVEPSVSGGDYAGWFLRQTPEFSTAISKWNPREEAFGFGAGVVLGSLPDSGRAWNVAAGLFMLTPGPVIMATGKGALFSPPPQLPEGDMGGGVNAPFGAAIALDLLRDRFTAELSCDLKIDAGGRNLVELAIPARIEASLKPPLDMELSIGRYRPVDARVKGRALDLFDIDFYLMATTRGIDDFPRDGRRLAPFAMAYGGSGNLSAGFSSSIAELRLNVEAGFDVGVSLASPPLLAGCAHVDGTLIARIACVGIDIGVETELFAVAPTPFELSGSAALRVNLPWPLPDIRFSGSFRIGAESRWPDDYPWPTDPVAEISLFPRPNGTAVMADGSGLDARVLKPDQQFTGVPVDAGLLVAFRAPVGNTHPQIGLTSTQSDDSGAPVWEVATEGQTDSGKPLRVGWRHVVTKVELRETGRPVPLKGGWSLQAAAGNAGAAAMPVGGGEGDRRKLHLMAPLDSPVERRYGTGVEALTEMVEGWQPCAPWINTKSLRVGFTVSNDSPLEKSPALRPGDWHRLDRHGSHLAGDAYISYESPPVELSLILPAHDVAGPRTFGLPPSLTLRLEYPHSHPPFMLSLPTASFAMQRDLDKALAFGTQLNMASGQLLIDLPVSGYSHQLMFLVRAGAHLDLRLDDNTPLASSEIYGGNVASDTGERWQLYRGMVPDGATRIYASALTLRHDDGSWFGSASIMFVGAALFADSAAQQEASERRSDASTQLVSDVAADAAGWAEGRHDGLLKPGIDYELVVEGETRHVRQVNAGALELGGRTQPFSRTVRFRTEDDIVRPLRPRIAAVAWAPEVTPEWSLDTLPAADAMHYRARDIEVRLADAVVAGRIAAHDRSLVLELVHESGRRTDQTAAQLVAAAKRDHSRLQDIIAEYIERQPCLVDAQPLWLSLSARYPTVLEPGRYSARLLGRDASGRGRDDTLLHSWRFHASAFEDFASHVLAHTSFFLPRDGSGADIAHKAARLLAALSDPRSDAAMERVWEEALGLPPRRPSAEPIVLVPVQVDGIACFVLDGPEPLMREHVQVEVEQDGSLLPLAGIAINSAGTRALICLARPAISGACTLRFSDDVASTELLLDLPTFEHFLEQL